MCDVISGDMYDEQLCVTIYRSHKGYSGNCEDCILYMHISYVEQGTSFCVLPDVAIFN
jgi:hypothetical protein